MSAGNTRQDVVDLDAVAFKTRARNGSPRPCQAIHARLDPQGIVK